MEKRIEVFGWGGAHLGFVASFGEAKQMQLASLPDDLKDTYAGWNNGYPAFYREDLTPELLAKYPQLAPEA
jgi:hypothetical protein